MRTPAGASRAAAVTEAAAADEADLRTEYEAQAEKAKCAARFFDDPLRRCGPVAARRTGSGVGPRRRSPSRPVRRGGFRQCCPGPVCGGTWEGHGLGGAAGAGGVCPDPKGAAPRGVGANEAGTADGEASAERPLRAPTTTETPAISRAIPAIPRRIGVCRPSWVRRSAPAPVLFSRLGTPTLWRRPCPTGRHRRVGQSRRASGRSARCGLSVTWSVTLAVRVRSWGTVTLAGQVGRSSGQQP